MELIKKELMSLSKKDILSNAIKEVHTLLDEGTKEPAEALIMIRRIKDFVEAYEKELKLHIDIKENIEMFGAKLSVTSGRKMVQYNEDSEYQRISDQLKERKAFLDASLKIKEDVIDSDGAVVPKVSIKYASDSITIKY